MTGLNSDLARCLIGSFGTSSTKTELFLDMYSYINVHRENLRKQL